MQYNIIVGTNKGEKTINGQTWETIRQKSGFLSSENSNYPDLAQAFSLLTHKDELPKLVKDLLKLDYSPIFITMILRIFLNLSVIDARILYTDIQRDAF
jgi:hypothetical protein